MTLAQQFRQEGRQEGLWTGKIQALEEFLNLPPTSRELLEGWTLEELEADQQRPHAEYENRFKRC